MGANGAGKTHFARALSAATGIPVTHYDALKLAKDWQMRSPDDIRARLADAVAAPRWILEGGPSMLPRALALADALVWLDPPTALRAFRLLLRPVRHHGSVRPELPAGNPDQLWQQWGFGARSLAATRQFRRTIAHEIAKQPRFVVWHCRTPAQTRHAQQHLADILTD